MTIMEQSHPLLVAIAVGKGGSAVAGPHQQQEDETDLALVKSSHQPRPESAIQDHNEGETTTDGSGSLNSDAERSSSSTTTDGTHHGSQCQHEDQALYVREAATKGKAQETEASAQIVSNGRRTGGVTKTVDDQQVNKERVNDVYQATRKDSQPEEEAGPSDHHLFSSRARDASIAKSAIKSQAEAQAAATNTSSSKQDQGNAKEKPAIATQHESTADDQNHTASLIGAPLTEKPDDGIETPVADFSDEQLWAFQEQLDDTTAALSVNVPDEQLWALKLSTAARDVLEFFLRSLACVRIESPAYEFAAIVKSLVLIALGFDMPISRLACSAGQDWRTCTLTLSDLKFTKLAKQKDADADEEDEDEVFACAKPHDHVVVEICTDKLIGASAKKWILKSSPDLLHTTLTPTSMAPLGEILYEPYNPMETFLETLGWRGLVVNEATGKLFRPASATASNTLRFVSEGNDGDLFTPVEPVFHAASRSLPRIFSVGTTALTSFNPNSSPFTQIRSSSKPATGLWAATTQPLPKKRLVEYVRSVTQGTGSHRIAEELLGSRSKVLEDEREWTGESAEDAGAVSDADSFDEAEGAASVRRQQVSDAAAFAEEVKRNRAARKSKRKGKDKESATSNSTSTSNLSLNGGRGGFSTPYRTQPHYYQAPPPPPFYGRRRGRHGNYWPPPPPGPHMPPHLYYGYGYAYPPMGYAQPPYYPAYVGYANPPAGHRGHAPFPAENVVPVSGAGGCAPPAGYGAPVPSAVHESVHGASTGVKTDQCGFPDLIRIDDDEADADSEGLETLPQLHAQHLPTEHVAAHFYQTADQMISSSCGSGDETPTPPHLDTADAFNYSLGGEHYIRREPIRVRALIVWKPNTLVEDARRAAERRKWSKEDLLGYAKELYNRSANADDQARSIKKGQADRDEAESQEQSLACGTKIRTARAADGRQTVLPGGATDDTQYKDDTARATTSTTIGSGRGTSQQLIIYNRCSLAELVVKAMLSRNVS